MGISKMEEVARWMDRVGHWLGGSEGWVKRSKPNSPVKESRRCPEKKQMELRNNCREKNKPKMRNAQPQPTKVGSNFLGRL